MNQKKENVILSQFCMGTKLLSDVGVCAALFRRKIWTKGGWYFLLVALYYCIYIQYKFLPVVMRLWDITSHVS